MAQWCEVDVSDNGVGIPAHALTSVFRRFSRAHADREDLAHVAGLGLGLAIVDDVMRALDGQVWVASVEGEGTTFTLRLPIRATGVRPSSAGLSRRGPTTSGVARSPAMSTASRASGERLAASHLRDAGFRNRDGSGSRSACDTALAA